MESVVTTQTTADIKIMMSDMPIPAWDTTHDSRRKSITPQMFSRHGISTPWKMKNIKGKQLDKGYTFRYTCICYSK